MSLPFRPNVCILLLNPDGKLFLGERLNNPGVWQFPQGGVEEGSSLEENVLREIVEETGADPRFFRNVRRLNATHQYDFKEPPDYARGKWRGQTQTFWLVDFCGVDSDFKLDRFSPEFMSFRWCTPAEVRELAETRRLGGYEPALKEVEALK